MNLRSGPVSHTDAMLAFTFTHPRSLSHLRRTTHSVPEQQPAAPQSEEPLFRTHTHTRSMSTEGHQPTECAVVAFGCNDDGQLGRGEKRRLTGPIDDVSAAHFPQQIEEIYALDIAAVSCGSRHTMVLTTKGEVYSWGWGSVRRAVFSMHAVDGRCIVWSVF